MGAAFGSLMLLGSGALYKLVRRREGMGMGDVKMMAMVGAFLGMQECVSYDSAGHIAGKHFGNRRDMAQCTYAEWDVSSRSGPAGVGWVR